MISGTLVGSSRGDQQTSPSSKYVLRYATLVLQSKNMLRPNFRNVLNSASKVLIAKLSLTSLAPQGDLVSRNKTCSRPLSTLGLLAS